MKRIGKHKRVKEKKGKRRVRKLKNSKGREELGENKKTTRYGEIVKK